MSKRLALLATVAFLTLSACVQDDDSTTPSAPSADLASAPRDALVEDGRDIAQRNCARCHAIGSDDASPNRRAPVFRTILSRYDRQALTRELIDGMRVAHAPMPQFQFNPAGADALIVFLESIQVHEPGRLLVEERCARCHSIGQAGASPYPGAQPFRNLGQRWKRDQLAQALRVGILAEHDRSGLRIEMRLSDQEVAEFIRFLDSIATPEHPEPR